MGRQDNRNGMVHRHDIGERVWTVLKPLLPGRRGAWGGVARDNRRFLNAVLWIARTGAPWRDLPADYGDWKNTHRRFTRWRDKGVWENILNALVREPDYEWLFIDASHAKAHQHAAGARGGTEAVGLTKGGETPKYTLPWIRMVCRCESLSLKAQRLIARRLNRLPTAFPPAP